MDTTVKHSQGQPPGDDSFEAIFALNMGDFIAEHFISDDLLTKISQSVSQDPDKLKSQLEELIQIYSLDKTLSLLGFSSNQGFVLYDSIAVSLAEMLQMDACHIFQTISKEDNKAQFLSLTGTSTPGVPPERWNIGYDLSDENQLVVQGYHEGYPMAVMAEDGILPQWKPLPQLNQEKACSVITVPLEEGQSLSPIGMMVFESYQSVDYAQETIDLAEATAKVFASSLHLQKLLDKAQSLVKQDNADIGDLRNLRAQLTEAIGDLGRYQQFFVESLAYAVDARNDFTLGHSQGVAQIAKSIAEGMSLNEKTIDLVYYAGLLGALGKIHVPQEILTKEEALTQAERESLKNSPNMGVGILMKMNFLAEVIPYIDYQKERWDGKDSPHGLSGRSIPLGARIIAVADAFHALTNPRPYRPEPMPEAKALNILQSEAGTKWDPDVVDTLCKMVSASCR